MVSTLTVQFKEMSDLKRTASFDIKGSLTVLD